MTRTCTWINHGTQPPCGKPARIRYARPEIAAASGASERAPAIEYFLCAEHELQLGWRRFLLRSNPYHWTREEIV